MTTFQSLEHHEHAEHAAQHGGKGAALLALVEVQAKHAEILVEENSVSAADSWSQYQAKSIRQAVARDIDRLAATMDVPAQPDRADARQALLKALQLDQERYEKDPKDGKDAIAAKARRFEEARDQTLERAHEFDNAAAALELGIVLATASAITASRMLIRLAMGMGVVGVGLGALGFLAPAMAPF
jgi:hypothetical protein